MDTPETTNDLYRDPNTITFTKCYDKVTGKIVMLEKRADFNSKHYSMTPVTPQRTLDNKLASSLVGLLSGAQMPVEATVAEQNKYPENMDAEAKDEVLEPVQMEAETNDEVIPADEKARYEDLKARRVWLRGTEEEKADYNRLRDIYKSL